MSQIVEINKQHFAFNLTWRELAGFESEKKEVHKYAKEINAVQHVILKGKTTLCGFLNAGSPKNVKVLYSAAAVFAVQCSSPDAVLITNLGQGQYSLIALRDGVPVPGLDIIDDGINVSDVAKEFISESGERGISLFGDASEFFNNAEQFSFENCNCDSRTKKIVITPIGTNKSDVIIMVALIVVVVGGYVAYEKWHSSRKGKVPAVETVDPVQQYIDNVRQLLATGGGNVTVLGNSFLKLTDSLPLIQNSWQLANVNCAHQNCAMTWKRVYGTYEEFVQDTNIDPQILTFKEDGSLITQTVSSVIPGKPEENPAGLNLESLPSFNHFLLTVGSLFQTYSAVDINTQIRQGEIFGTVVDANLPSSIPGGFVKKGTWLLSGDYVYAAEVVNQIPNYMTLEGFSVDLDQDGLLKFKLEGNYYVRN
jgi:hypothetical protein